MDSKKMAQKAAKKLAQEPIEIFKTAARQVTGAETQKPPENYQPALVDSSQEKANEDRAKENDGLKSVRRVEALNRELSDIQKQDVFTDLQRRISEGEVVPLADYTELSMDQKQVLKAQMEAVKTQNAAGDQSGEALVEPSAKPGRQFGITRKQEVQRQQTRIEKPVPPSG